MVNKEFIVGCMSPQHVDKCPCVECNPKHCDTCHKWNMQHDVPEKIQTKIFGLKGNELLQYTHPESKVCHARNDRRVNHVIKGMLRNIEREGINTYTIQDVLRMRESGIFRGK
jgi:hypothetical protein